MADIEFGTEFPELNLLTIEETIVDGQFIQHVMVDENVIATRKHGSSMWTQTAQIFTSLPDGSPKSYFLKISAGILGFGMAEGEYESIAAIHKVKPEFCPKPHGWGTFKSNPYLHFLFTDFVEMKENVPEKDTFTTKLAECHHASMGLSPMDNTWTDTWEECYKNNIVRMLQLEAEARGSSEELNELTKPLLQKVIPRLLRPLETSLNYLKPCFLHGDLWHRNTATELSTGKPITFDASAFWGHNEYEVRTMRTAGGQFDRSYLNSYYQKCPLRSRLRTPKIASLFMPCKKSYIVSKQSLLMELEIRRSRIHDPALYSMNDRYRTLLIEQMRLLVERFPNGYEEPKTKI
ncbi:hypothetical protein GLAREA_10427 [Glarea lozoyensis ATCC 20868]|uniref:protein-ribulosamine 3-kinase n=1 Tax=Glarea lozoyensis (strain ATCC 20868 / MF5171) TaxID=1116229 RepID=S3E8X6_GLAL2|nr:uncharacterized protein GLAREA_10427 [Glarea lozoyensis ATCC 20868]EPE34733.1 hypothetical protein GLAREA_10427 [Glarea lozoyensis ATCC 20868]